MIFGRSTIEDMASALCIAFQQQSHLIIADTSTEEDLLTLDEIDHCHQDKKPRYSPLVSRVEMRRLIYLLSLPAGSSVDLSSPTPETSPSADANPSQELHTLQSRYGQYLHPMVSRALAHLEQSESTDQSTDSDISLQSYVDLICQHSPSLPGLSWLSITACCLFGLQPASPISEKEFITELMLWKEAETMQSSRYPFGRVGTEWAVVSSDWWLKWSYYVGRSNRDEQTLPPPIDNWGLLKKTSSLKQLLPDLVLGTDFEIITPEVFHAFQAWYGGGPKLIRKVILSTPTPTTSRGVLRDDAVTNSTLPSLREEEQKPIIEFYPLWIKLFYCDDHGNCPENVMTFEQMWSRHATIQEVISEICLNKGYLDHDKIRLWNSESKIWKKHFIYAKELTLSQAGITDGQILMIERQLNNGVWPKSQLHSQLGNHSFLRPVSLTLSLIAHLSTSPSLGLSQ
jgi:hypothetical protein